MTRSEDEKFIAHLGEASKIVKKWPLWKQNVLGVYFLEVESSDKTIEGKDAFFNQLGSDIVDEDWCLENGAILYDLWCRWTINGHVIDWFDGSLIINGVFSKNNLTKDQLKQLLECLKGCTKHV